MVKQRTSGGVLGGVVEVWWKGGSGSGGVLFEILSVGYRRAMNKYSGIF